MTDYPPDWKVVPLREVVPSVDYGVSFPLSYGGQTPVLRMNNIFGGEFVLNDVKTCSARVPDGLMLRPGDVLFNRTNSMEHVGRAAVWRGEPDKFSFASYLVRLVNDESVLRSGYLSYWLNLPRTQREIRGYATAGVQQVNVNPTNLRKISIAFPASLVEQDAIVDALDAIDGAIRSMERTILKLESVRVAIISTLLEQILGRSRMAKVGDEFEIKSGVTLGPVRVPRSRQGAYLRVANVRRGSIDLQDLALIEEYPGDRPGYAIRDGDLLVVEGHANPHEIGRCALVGEEAAGLMFQNHLFRLRSKAIVPKFAEVWLNSSAVREYWLRTCSSSSGLYTINSKQLANVSVPVPPVEEQVSIASRIWQVEGLIRAARDRQGKLRRVKSGLMNDLLGGRPTCGL